MHQLNLILLHHPCLELRVIQDQFQLPHRLPLNRQDRYLNPLIQTLQSQLLQHPLLNLLQRLMLAFLPFLHRTLPHRFLLLLRLLVQLKTTQRCSQFLASYERQAFLSYWLLRHPLKTSLLTKPLR